MKSSPRCKTSPTWPHGEGLLVPVWNHKRLSKVWFRLHVLSVNFLIWDCLVVYLDQSQQARVVSPTALEPFGTLEGSSNDPYLRAAAQCRRPLRWGPAQVFVCSGSGFWLVQACWLAGLLARLLVCLFSALFQAALVCPQRAPTKGVLYGK